MTEQTENCALDYSTECVESLYLDVTSPATMNKNSEELADTHKPVLVPEYLTKTYYWSYLNPRNVNWLDNEPIVKSILWWQHNKLRTAAFSQIEPGNLVLQVAAVYGDFSIELAQHIGTQGQLKLVDVAPIQVRNTQKKLAKFSHAEVVLADAADFNDQQYDVVLCYFLLHEIPDNYKTKVIDNLLQHIKPNGKLVIVDYHKPHWAHPVKPITSLIFDTLEPFAKTLWRQSIQQLSSNPEAYDWQHQTYFGGLYQRVVVQHKSS